MHLDRIGDVAEIRYDPDFDSFSPEAKPHRIDGVVRDSEAADLDIAYREAGSRSKTVERRSEVVPEHAVGREARHVYWKRMLALTSQRHQPANVIGVLMRNQDGIQIFDIFADDRESRQRIAAAETRVDENSRAPAGNERAIA